MRFNNAPADIVVAWSSPNCDTRYSVSIMDTEGNEIRCVGGDDDLDEAWDLACRTAERIGVPAQLQPHEDGQVSRRWVPDTVDESDDR